MDTRTGRIYSTAELEDLRGKSAKKADELAPHLVELSAAEADYLRGHPASRRREVLAGLRGVDVASVASSERIEELVRLRGNLTRRGRSGRA